jgi:hypothetical protein
MGDEKPKVVGYVVSKPGGKKVIAYVVEKSALPEHSGKLGHSADEVAGYVVSKPGSNKVVGYMVPELPPKLPKSRQEKAFRRMIVLVCLLLLVPLALGAQELHDYGYKFFVHRTSGFGSTPGNETDTQFFLSELCAPKDTSVRQIAAPPCVSSGQHHSHKANSPAVLPSSTGIHSHHHDNPGPGHG